MGQRKAETKWGSRTCTNKMWIGEIDHFFSIEEVCIEDFCHIYIQGQFHLFPEEKTYNASVVLVVNSFTKFLYKICFKGCFHM